MIVQATINYVLLAAAQVPIVESRQQYLSLMENIDVQGLAKMFKQLRSKRKSP